MLWGKQSTGKCYEVNKVQERCYEVNNEMNNIQTKHHLFKTWEQESYSQITVNSNERYQLIKDEGIKYTSYDTFYFVVVYKF